MTVPAPMHVAEAAPARTFFPRSRVLLERRPVTFESDNEDDGAPVAPPAPVADPAADVAEIAYVHGSRVESERFDLRREELLAALVSLPHDAWTTLLDATDRSRLAAFLPSLDGWHDMPHDEAQRVAVEALLARENLHFGNPLTALEAQVRAGDRTLEATRAREAAKRQASARFALERDTVLFGRRETLGKKKARDRNGEGDEAPPEWKKMRLPSGFPFIHRSESVDFPSAAVVSENTSLFLALRSILVNAALTIEGIVQKLRLDFPRQCASAENDLPLFLTFDKYVTAALTFLSHEHLSGDSADWSTAVFVYFHRESGQYEWCTEENGGAIRSLLLLEQVFRAPIANDALDFTNNSSGVIATRKRRNRIATLRARDALLASDPAFAALDEYESPRPSAQLKLAQIQREASTAIGSDSSAAQPN